MIVRQNNLSRTQNGVWLVQRSPVHKTQHKVCACCSCSSHLLLQLLGVEAAEAARPSGALISELLLCLHVLAKCPLKHTQGTA